MEEINVQLQLKLWENFDSIEEYINQLSCNVETIAIASKKIKILPNNIFLRFTKLKRIYLGGGQITRLPNLPPSLEELNCGFNKLIELSDLPSSLRILDCRYNKLEILPELPSTLTFLECSNNRLKTLPELPSNLTHIYCCFNELENFPFTLTSCKLVVFYCRCNQLINLPSFPSSLKELNCNQNQLHRLPDFPSSLTYISCSYNELKCLPKLPVLLKVIYCDYNNLSNLPELPDALIKISLYGNPFVLRYENESPILNDKLEKLKKEIKTIIRLNELFYALKFKNQFRRWLWELIREPKIRAKYHPDNLLKILEENSIGEMDVDQIDAIMDQW